MSRKLAILVLGLCSLFRPGSSMPSARADAVLEIAPIQSHVPVGAPAGFEIWLRGITQPTSLVGPSSIHGLDLDFGTLLSGLSFAPAPTGTDPNGTGFVMASDFYSAFFGPFPGLSPYGSLLSAPAANSPNLRFVAVFGAGIPAGHADMQVGTFWVQANDPGGTFDLTLDHPATRVSESETYDAINDTWHWIGFGPTTFTAAHWTAGPLAEPAAAPLPPAVFGGLALFGIVGWQRWRKGRGDDLVTR